MQELIEVTKELAAMPPGVLAWLAVLGVIGLAAFAIHAVLTLAKERR